MRIAFDEYSHLNSPLHKWRPEYKLVGLAALVFAFAAVDDWRLLPAMLGITGVLYSAAKLPLSFLLKRLRYPGFFLLGVVLLLPFLSGETVLWQWGPVTLRQEGCLAVVLISGRFLAILTISLVLLGTTPFLTFAKALRSLGLPWILTDMMALFYRYLNEIGDNLATMQQAMRLRGFGSQRRSRLGLVPDRREFCRFASLAGTLLVRSYEQSERVYKAMRLRGYGQEQARTRVSSADGQRQYAWALTPDALALWAILLVALGLVIVDTLY